MKIVREYSTICIDYLVQTDDEEQAKLMYRDGEYHQIDVTPKTIAIEKIEVRNMSEKDQNEFLVKKIINNLDADESPTPKKKRTRKTKEEKTEREKFINELMGIE